MFCQKCGKINPDNAEKCTGCGALLEKKEVLAVSKKSKIWKTIALALLIVLVICIVVFFLSGCGGANVRPDEKVLF